MVHWSHQTILWLSAGGGGGLMANASELFHLIAVEIFNIN